ncbi:hypothetical protein M0657_002226 [Pyricularia oryzae]|nr:hypothetical protein M9X92_009795 [Pyricularia oryzae]KAI7929548.1 hypothetical protein M0657_002226 [Pyricularia oryzae]
MNWTRDNQGIDQNDLQTVFKYEPKGTTVLHMLSENKYKLSKTSLELDKQWETWLSEDMPSINDGISGLVIILAGRVDEPRLPAASISDSENSLSGNCPAAAAASLSDTEKKLISPQTDGQPKRARSVLDVLSPKVVLGSKVSDKSAGGLQAATADCSTMGRRGVRTLPFSLASFERISQAFHTHGTIARVISRSDVPVFSADKIIMAEQPAYVYNCRSSNAWAHDMALSVTHFPNADLTLAILYGCHEAAETQIVKRLAQMEGDAAVSHPLLTPGIFAELEMQRHKQLILKTVLLVESHIYERDALQQSLDGGGGRQAALDKATRDVQKRNAFLETSYFRNGLVSWNTQLGAMAEEAEDLQRLAGKAHVAADTSSKVGRRVRVIRNEYEDWIRECTMRLDGMTMATQWAQNETNLEIALETKRDSKHMRSIALLTMVFLPGTFLAAIVWPTLLQTVFSMDFFEWNADDQGLAKVSRYIWLYFIITFLLTLGTLGLWWYFVIYRPSRQSVPDEEEDDEDDGREMTNSKK